MAKFRCTGFWGQSVLNFMVYVVLCPFGKVVKFAEGVFHLAPVLDEDPPFTKLQSLTAALAAVVDPDPDADA